MSIYQKGNRGLSTYGIYDPLAKSEDVGRLKKMAYAEKKTEQAGIPDYTVSTPITGKEKVFWQRIGAAWINKDGKGINVVLNALPVNNKICLFPSDEERE